MTPGRVSVFGRFLDLVRTERLIHSGSRVLVAVSGGLDSVCLLDLVLAARGRLGFEVRGFHLDHRLRPESAADARFVRELFARRGVEARVGWADVAGHARRRRLGIEEAAREIRYRRMEREARATGCDRVALGHTADDNLETQLLNLVRGSGPRGLAGIPVRRGRFIRPLLDIERRELFDYARARCLEWVEDASNLDPAFRRNRLRLQVVPVLKELNPAAARAARRAAALLAGEDGYLDARAALALDRCAGRGRGRVVIDLNDWASYSVVLRRRMMRLLVPGLDADAVEEALRLMGRRTDGRLPLGRGAELARRGDRAEILTRGKE